MAFAAPQRCQTDKQGLGCVPVASASGAQPSRLPGRGQLRRVAGSWSLRVAGAGVKQGMESYQRA
jgi:hypothetical protein